MIPYFQSYNDFINHLNSHYISYRQLFDFSLLNDDFQSAFFKMIWLDVDNTFDILRSLYSNTGRPAKNQIQFLRSFILMAHFKYFSIKKWVKRLKKQNALAVICGFDPLDVPSFSSHYDFIHRLFLKKKYTHDDFVCENKPYKNIDTKSKPKNGSKLVNFNISATDELLHVFTDNSNPVDELEEKILLQLFNVLAVNFSFNHHLIENHITISGDGTCLHTHASKYGTKVDDNHRRYSDLDANIGWDSDLNTFYYGYTAYSISTINHKYNIDLPMFLSIASASQHDAITSMTALAQLCAINNFISFDHYCLDCASDNVSTHKLCYSLGILPVIDINKRSSNKNLYLPYKDISKNGRPIYAAGFECIRDGFEKARNRHKFRCPFAFKKENTCPLKDKCTKSKYGRVFQIKVENDLRLFGVIQYNSQKWKTIYKDRTSCERMNNRILNDYKFKDCYMHGESRTFFMLVMIGINIHFDAYLKITSL